MAEVETNHFGDDVGTADRAMERWKRKMSNLKNKPKVKLDNWAIVNGWEFPITPDSSNPHLSGYVSGHPRFDDGTYVRTSYTVDFDITQKFVETNNTYYELGEPAPEYVRFCEAAGVDLAKYGMSTKLETTAKKRCPGFSSHV